jgi:hypothetical protein
MAAGYIYARLSEVAHELLAKVIPHRYVPGKHHGKVEGGGWQWDLRVDANGQEGIFEELQLQIWRYEQERYDVTYGRSLPSEGRGWNGRSRTQSGN